MPPLKLPPGAPAVIPRLLMQDENAAALWLITYILNRNFAEQTIGCAIGGVQQRSAVSAGRCRAVLPLAGITDMMSFREFRLKSLKQ